MATIADWWRSEGRREGKAEFLARQLGERFGPLPEHRRVQLGSASEEDLERWALRSLRVADLESVFG